MDIAGQRRTIRLQLRITDNRSRLELVVAASYRPVGGLLAFGYHTHGAGETRTDDWKTQKNDNAGHADR